MKVVNISLSLIDEDNEQPRTSFDDISINELAESIEQVGLLNPIKVRLLDTGRYKIIFGNRRYKACKKLGLEEIPCILTENDNEIEIYLEQLTENIQRENFTPIEEANAFQKMIDEHNWSKKMLSGQLGKGERYISKKLDLLIFGESVRKLIHGKKEILPNSLNEEQALKLKNVPVEYRDNIAVKIAQDQMSVPDVEKISQLFLDKKLSPEMKEKLLRLKCDDIVSVWTEKQIAETRLPDIKSPQKKELSVATEDDIPSSTEKYIEEQIYKISPLQEKAEYLLNRIPSFNPLPADLINSIDELTIDTRENFYDSVCILINMLTAHMEEWKTVKNLIEVNRSSKSKIKLVKS